MSLGLPAGLFRSEAIAHAVWTSFFLLVAVLAGAVIGWGAVSLSPFTLLFLLVGLTGSIAVAFSPGLAIIGLMAIVWLLPFGTLPFRIGFRFSLLDLATGALLFLFTWQVCTHRQRIPVRPAIIAVTLYAILLIVSAGNGLRFGVTEDAITLSTKLVSSALLFVMLTAWLQTADGIRRAAAWFLAFAAVEALIGVALYFLPAGQTIGILSRLGRIGYPVGGRCTTVHYRHAVASCYGNKRRSQSARWRFGFCYRLRGCALGTSTKALVAARHAGPLSAVPPPHTVTCCLNREWRGHLRSHNSALPRAAVALPIRRTGNQSLYRKLVPCSCICCTVFVHRIARRRFGWTNTQSHSNSSESTLGLVWDLGPRLLWTPLIGVSNIYLQLAEVGGLLTLAAFGLAVGAVLAAMWQGWRKGVPPETEWVVLGAGAGLLGVLVTGIFDHYYVSFPHMATMFWSVAGIGVAAAWARHGPEYTAGD